MSTKLDRYNVSYDGILSRAENYSPEWCVVVFPSNVTNLNNFEGLSFSVLNVDCELKDIPQIVDKAIAEGSTVVIKKIEISDHISRSRKQ
jgi:hypothetical protein